MDYKKSNAPLTTVTWDTDQMSSRTGNIYETVMIISKRANQIGVEMKEELNKNCRSLLRIQIIWKRYLKIANKSKYQSFMSGCQNPLFLQPRSLLKEKSITVILRRISRLRKNRALFSIHSISDSPPKVYRMFITS